MIKKIYSKLLTPKNISRFAQFWFAGAMYFLIAWGTGIAKTSLLDLVFFLGVGIGLVDSFIVGPILAEFSGEGTRVKYMERTLGQKIVHRLFSVVKSIFIVILIMFTYQLINAVLQMVFTQSAQTPVIMGEPILFGILYMVYARTLAGIYTWYKSKRSVIYR
ncbi:hypothetical protein SAMN05421839_13022 [Halolactibacillus halophilus]|uniref:Uncharacterized protein n=1 Tax=Halolactibacillus halophilus TaxID=306540 RepID=A0A1I5RHQ1_9BACI|nr:hypothetical protein [Halolactibacillus halophilus]GEM02362.1 hypothetical protein HHA03_18940 [Halolactibacillus halophilus]SFP58055.1 hypothetical protein SAMN05421839_13022 [Halolactibacillus halophilus]